VLYYNNYLIYLIIFINSLVTPPTIKAVDVLTAGTIFPAINFVFSLLIKWIL